MEKKTKCSSCKSDLINNKGSVTFKCPQCGKADITRCHKCRELSTKYKCSQCEFEGP